MFNKSYSVLRQEKRADPEADLIYKLPKSSRQEIEAMFSLSDLKNTKEKLS
jgi:hypothetical protein